VDPGELVALRSAALANISRPRRWRALAAVGAVCLAGLAALFWSTDRFTVSIGLRPTDVAAVHYESAYHEPSSITFEDGTIAFLDADSAADVSYSETRRLVTLRRGRAFFDVAKNPSRPFIVAAADRRVTALGTRFQVRLGPGQMEVVLLEGSVSVEPSNSWFDFSMLRRAPVMLRPGQRLSAVAGEPLEITLVDADALTSWRDEADARR
jgi:transmembrane sensor